MTTGTTATSTWTGSTTGRRSTVFTNAPAGMQFQGDEGFPGSGNTFDHMNQFAPRVGLAWDPRGDNVQTIRAAAGIYYDSPKLWQYGRHPLNAPFGNTIQVNQPASVNDPWAAYPGGNPFPTPNPPPSNIQFPTLGTYVTMPLDLEPMRVTQWNVSYQLQFASSWMASVSYLGNCTDNIWIGKELNPSVYIPGNSTQANQDARRVLTLLNPGARRVLLDDPGVVRGLGPLPRCRPRPAEAAEQRLEHEQQPDAEQVPQQRRARHRHHQRLPRSERSRAPTGVRATPIGPYILNSSFIYQSKGVGSGFLRTFTDDWQIGTVLQARSGAPLTPATTGNLSLTGLGNQRPVVVGDPDLDDRDATLWFNTAAFAPNTAGTWGDTPRGFLRGPAFWNLDLALSRVVRFAGQQRVELRAEAFNVTNRVAPGQSQRDARQRELRPNHQHPRRSARPAVRDQILVLRP